MIWVLYALLSGFSFATADVFTKKVGNIDSYLLTWFRFLFSVPIVLIPLFFIRIPELDINFLYILLVALAIEIVAWILYVKAITTAPLSLTVPFLSLTPVFLLLTSFLILGEFPGKFGVYGILLVVVGAYLLNFDKRHKSPLQPFKSIFKEKGALYMVIVAFLFSITSNLGKILILKSSPLFMSAIYFPLLTIAFSPLVFFKLGKNKDQITKNTKSFFLIGLFFGLMQIFHVLAIKLTLVPYMMSVKRTSSLFGVLYGVFLFKEKFALQRVFATAIMLAGVLLITLF